MLKLTVLLVVLAGAVVAYVSLLPDPLARYKARLAARGEELALTRLLPPYSGEVADYQQQLGDATAGLVILPIHPSDIAPMNRTTTGFARAASAQPAPSGKGPWEDLETQMKRSEPALSELRRLLAAPVNGNGQAQMPPFSSKSAFDLVSRRKAAQTFAAAAVNDLHWGRLDVALTNLRGFIALARFNDEGGLLVDRMIQVAIGGLALAVTWETLQAPGWTEAELASMQSDWQRIELARGFAHTAEMERASAVAYYELMRTNNTERRQMFGGRGGKGFADRLYEGFYLPFWAVSWSKGDELSFLETVQPIVEGTRSATTNGDYHAMRTAVAAAIDNIHSRQTALNRFRYPLASMVVPNWEKATTTLLRYETQRQMAITALALKRYQLKHGKLPASLAALTPEFLPAAPIDCMNGRLLTYVRISDERFTLRSVGNDEQDDGGAGDDLTWPELEGDSPVGLSPP